MKTTAMVTGLVVVVDGVRMEVTRVARDWCNVRGPNGEAWRVRREMLQAWR